jgi:uncharacterized protein YPO0396
VNGPLEGFRLERLEVLNWGTFHKAVWSFKPGGRDALLTGDIGSGKSTLVDAIGTLLLPTQKVAFNKAAGADKRERDLRSYVLGHHRSETVEATGLSRAVPLRGPGSYSVILGVFANAAVNSTVSLAKVFWYSTDPAGQPERFHVIADAGLSIAEHFREFGSDIAELRKRLRRIDGCEVLGSEYTKFGTLLRRKLGIASEQALELFHQTVSMKSVGSLDQFVREHMLEPFDTAKTVGDIVAHFEDLDQAHKAVIRAEQQIQRLGPLLEQCDRYDRHAETIASATAQREALRPYLASLRIDLLQRQRTATAVRKRETEDELEVTTERRKALDAESREAERERDAAGGQELSRIETQIEDLKSTAAQRRSRFEEFAGRLRSAGLDPVADRAQFADRLQAVDRAAITTRQALADVDNRLAETYPERNQLEGRAQANLVERQSLERRRSNIPAKLLQLRDALATVCDVDDAMLPFAGELIQVDESESAWRPTAERLLRAFATSMLVPDDLYPQVADWIDRHHLKTRLTYYRIVEGRTRRPQLTRRGRPLMVDKLKLKSSEFSDWLEAELEHRAGHECCETIEEFRRSSKAVTLRGQLKEPGGRHVKDDTDRIDDRTKWVLGWDAAEKLAALRGEAEDLRQRIDDLAQEQESAKTERERLRTMSNVLAQLAVVRDFADIDHWGAALRIEELSGHLRALKSKSGKLEMLTKRIEKLKTDIEAAEKCLARLNSALGAIKGDIERIDRELEAEQRRSAGLDAVSEEVLTAVKRLLTDELPDADLASAEGCLHAEADAKEKLTGRIEAAGRGQSSASGAAAGLMQSFLGTWPEYRQEMDPSIEARTEYRLLAERLTRDDLPRYKEKFEEYLRTNTIREIAAFFHQLNKHSTEIGDRIEVINGSLRGVEFNPGRYIELEARKSPNTEVRDFQRQLRECTEDATGADDEGYTEQKFKQVAAVIDRLRGREGYAGIDKSWRERVTDVRNWFTFLARERDRETGEEHESYADSDGKSGGQKEKLAYTILAASLAYQYRLDDPKRARGQFRFVVIDEAFGRGSEESSRFGMDLFTRMGLQLLVVTPLEKIEVIEEFVSAVGFVDNPTGSYSRLQNLTIKEYRERRSSAGQSRVDE